MREDVKLFVIIAGIVVIGSIGLAQQSSFSMPMPVDFDDWTEETYPPLSGSFPESLWTIDDPPTNSMITQSVNGQPTFFFSDFTAYNKKLTITMTVDPATTDDDFIGFAIGFNQGDASPGDSAADYLILDWKQTTQTFDFEPVGNGGEAPIGMALSRVSGVPSPDELWQHADLGDGSGSVTEIVRATSLGNVGWVEGEVNTFEITYQPSRIIVKVNGQEEFNEIGSFPNGMVTLYNFSQDMVTYQATSLVIIPEALPDSQTVSENSINNVLAPTLTGSDDDGSPLTGFTISTPPTDGTLDTSGASISCDDPAIPVTCTFGPVTYTPNPDFFGSDPFEFTVTDGIDTSLPALFEITIDDGDGIDRDVDNCPSDANPGQEDVDGNGIGDACQDLDGDTVLDLDDNCPFIPNPLQEDVLPEEGGNGIGDVCESTELLLVDATFPPGDTLEIELPEDPENPATETITLSLELPENVGGDVTVEITDAGDTEANFSFLGTIIDLTAPCTDVDVCGVSFTFTQELLDELGLTLDEVTIFHDGEITETNPEGLENGSFEEDEAIPTTINDNGDGTFTATGFPSSTSKFSVGGIKALALGALAGGTGGSRGGAPPTLENFSFDGAKIVNEDGTIGFGGLIIDEISTVNDFPTQTFEVGTPFELHFPFFEDNGAGAVEHVAVYVLNDDGDTVYDSDLYVSIDRYLPLEAYDSNGYISNYTVNLVEQSANLVDVVFGFTFTQPLGPSDIIVRAWDLDRRTIDYRFNQFIQVVEADSSSALIDSPANDDSIIESSTIVQYDLESSSEINDSTEDSENNQIEIPLWIKFNANWWSQEKIGDDDFVAGIQYLVENDIIRIPELEHEPHEGVNEIPAWIKSNAEWWANDIVSDEEFVSSIQWLIKEGVVKVEPI